MRLKNVLRRRAGPDVRIQAKSRLPIQPPSPELPNARLKAIATHRTASRPMAKKFCMSMPSTFFDLTMPP